VGRKKEHVISLLREWVLKLITRGRKQCIYGGTAKVFLLSFLSILWGPAPKPLVLTSFEGKVILTVYFER
jgi:hypothetical protein